MCAPRAASPMPARSALYVWFGVVLKEGVRGGSGVRWARFGTTACVCACIDTTYPVRKGCETQIREWDGSVRLTSSRYPPAPPGRGTTATLLQPA